MPDVGFLSTLSVNDGASQAYAAFPATVEVAIPDVETGTEDATPLSQADKWKRFISKRLTDPGVLKMTQFFSKPAYLRLAALQGLNCIPTTIVKVKWKLTTPDPDAATVTLVGMKYETEGILTKLGGPKLNKDGIMVFEIEVKCSGPPTIGDDANNPTPPTQAGP